MAVVEVACCYMASVCGASLVCLFLTMVEVHSGIGHMSVVMRLSSFLSCSIVKCTCMYS